MKYLTEVEEKKLLRTVREVKGRKAERDYMVLYLGFNTGLRLNEIISLNVGDVRGKDRLYVRPETTKRTRRLTSEQAHRLTSENKQLESLPACRLVSARKRAEGRTIPLSVKLQQEIRHFLKLKLQWRELIQDDAPLFISKKGGRLSKRALQEMFETWSAKAGLSACKLAGTVHRFTVHSMRHSFAKRLLQRGVQLPTVQKLLGHASLASTGVYTEAGIEEMQEAVEAR